MRTVTFARVEGCTLDVEPQCDTGRLFHMVCLQHQVWIIILMKFSLQR